MVSALFLISTGHGANSILIYSQKDTLRACREVPPAFTFQDNSCEPPSSLCDGQLIGKRSHEVPDGCFDVVLQQRTPLASRLSVLGGSFLRIPSVTALTTADRPCPMLWLFGYSDEDSHLT